MNSPGWFRRGLPAALGARRLVLLATAIVLLVALALASMPDLARRVDGLAASRPRPTSTHDLPRRASRQAVLALARDFLDSYLKLVYGQEPSGGIRDATPALKASLARERVPAPPALRALHPRIVGLSLVAAQAPTITVSASVKDDEVLAYRLTLQLTTTRDGRLLVARVGES